MRKIKYDNLIKSSAYIRLSIYFLAQKYAASAGYVAL